MKWKIFIFIASMAIVGAGTAIGILGFENGTAIYASTPSTPCSTPQVVTSRDIGALFNPQFQQITYASFAPIITESEAIATAKNLLTNGFHVPTDNLKVETTVALFSGQLEKESNPADRVVSNVPAWIMVIKDVPIGLSVGPPPDPDQLFVVKLHTQWNVAIDARTGELLYDQLASKEEKVPIQ
jgi:hypothetical protein